MRKNIALELHNAVAAVCPIDGVSIGDFADRSTWYIDFNEANPPSAEQKYMAQKVLAEFDIEAVQEPIVTPEQLKAMLVQVMDMAKKLGIQ